MIKVKKIKTEWRLYGVSGLEGDFELHWDDRGASEELNSLAPQFSELVKTVETLACTGTCILTSFNNEVSRNLLDQSASVVEIAEKLFGSTEPSVEECRDAAFNIPQQVKRTAAAMLLESELREEATSLRIHISIVYSDNDIPASEESDLAAIEEACSAACEEESNEIESLENLVASVISSVGKAWDSGVNSTL